MEQDKIEKPAWYDISAMLTGSAIAIIIILVMYKSGLLLWIVQHIT